jgi:LPS export ABC transporter protein LptC
MTRITLWGILLGVVVLAVGCGKSPDRAKAPVAAESKPTVTKAQQPVAKPPKDIAQDKPSVPELEVKGRLVTISWDEKGKISMQATATEMTGNTVSGTATIKKVKARLFSNGRQTGTLVAPLVQADEGSRVLTASGGVALTSSDPKSSIRTVKCQWIKWYSRENRIVGGGGVKAHGPVASIDAAAFIADTQLRNVRILSDPSEIRAMLGKQ